MKLKYFLKIVPILILFLCGDFIVAQRRGFASRGGAARGGRSFGSMGARSGFYGARQMSFSRPSMTGAGRGARIGSSQMGGRSFQSMGARFGGQRFAGSGSQGRAAGSFGRTGFQRSRSPGISGAGMTRRDFGRRDLGARTFRRGPQDTRISSIGAGRRAGMRPFAGTRQVSDRGLRDRRSQFAGRRTDGQGRGPRGRFGFRDRALRDQRLNLSRSLSSTRFGRFRTADRIQRQRGFLSKNFRGHPWSWWWNHNRGYFYRYFPTYFYDSYGYYPPIYYDYYELYGSYPTQVYSTAIIEPGYPEIGPDYAEPIDEYGPTDISGAALLAGPSAPPLEVTQNGERFVCDRECVKNCLNNTDLSLEECCSQQCAQ